jgi:hypothetical protein
VGDLRKMLLLKQDKKKNRLEKREELDKMLEENRRRCGSYQRYLCLTLAVDGARRRQRVRNVSCVNDLWVLRRTSTQQLIRRPLTEL